jgi:CBS domain-containing protein
MSPRAACRLEALGFGQVYDYAPGKVDWLAHGLPTEGEEEPPQRAVDAVDAVDDRVITCGLDDLVGAVRDRVADSAFGFALVTSPSGILLGRLRKAALEGDPQRRAEELMESGPSTVRPHIPLKGLLARLAERDLRAAIVTTPEGRLLGVIQRR